jgi:hypothetical protein
MTMRLVLFLGIAACAAVAAAAVAYVTTGRPLATPLDPQRVDLSALDHVPDEVWARLRTQRIYFGHQSVGENVITGLQWILDRKPRIGLRIVSASVPGAFREPGLIHGPIGVNGDAQSKIKDFDAVVRGPEGARLDVAFMKFCYVDVGTGTDPDAIMSGYRSTIESISQSRPQLQVVHTTMPLTALEIGRKALVRRMIGFPSAGESVNSIRGKYNEALRSSFDQDAIFDLAAIEAVAPGHEPQSLDEGGRNWATLAPELTDDGGHLNTGGSVLVARELLLQLARHAQQSVSASHAAIGADS